MHKLTLAAIALTLTVVPMTSDTYAQACGFGAGPCPQATMPETPSPEVCFHTAENFKGKAYCEIGPRTDPSVPKHWRNLVKSISVRDNAKVRVCRNETLQGECAWFDGNIRRLEPGLYNHVHSFDIRQVY